MESFLFAVSAVTPIILTVVVGYLLKRVGLINELIVKALNKLVFRVFLPSMLFLNVYKIDSLGEVDLSYVLYAFCVVAFVFFVCIPFVMLVTKRKEARGVILQAAFRSNFALIGLPLAQSLFGEEGLIVASLMSAFIIPVYNVLAVISLSIFGCGGKKPSVKGIAADIVKNPLIQSIVLGLIVLAIREAFVSCNIAFRLSDMTHVYAVLENLSGVATPLALIALGAQFEFSAISGMKKEIAFGTAVRTLIVPALAIGTAYVFFRDVFDGSHFATFVALFATPIAVSSVPMTQEMGSDTALAGQLVVWTTVVSALTVFLATFLLKLGGIL